ncbi:MAG: hypothetical protein AB7U70_09880 [Acinetobacter sp.]
MRVSHRQLIIPKKPLPSAGAFFMPGILIKKKNDKKEQFNFIFIDSNSKLSI